MVIMAKIRIYSNLLHPLLWSSIPSACKTSGFWSVLMGYRSTPGIS